MEHHANYYTPDGKLLPFGEADYPPEPEKDLNMPVQLNEMIKLAERLSSNHAFLRVDFYELNGVIFFGELTFYPASGMGRFTEDNWDMELGGWLTLPSI